MDRTGSRSCPVAIFCINDVEHSGSATRELLNRTDTGILVVLVDVTYGNREITAF
jgi:hypothetical protein